MSKSRVNYGVGRTTLLLSQRGLAMEQGRAPGCSWKQHRRYFASGCGQIAGLLVLAEALGDFVEDGVGVFVDFVVAAEGLAQGYGFVEANAIGYVEAIDEFGGAEQQYAFAGRVEFAPFAIQVGGDGLSVFIEVELYKTAKLF